MFSGAVRTLAGTATDPVNSDSTECSWMAVMLHFSDSALPVGAYAHSFGLEGLCQCGVLHDEMTLRKFLLRDVRHSLASVDLPLVARAHRAALDGKGDAVRHWDELSWALRPTRQLREAAGKVGKQLWLIYEETWRSQDALSSPDWFGTFQVPVVLGAIFAERGAPVESCLWAVAYQTYAAFTQAALKLLPVGPAATQRMLCETLDKTRADFSKILSMGDADLGAFNPLWDIAASRHERASARMFLS